MKRISFPHSTHSVHSKTSLSFETSTLDFTADAPLSRIGPPRMRNVPKKHFMINIHFPEQGDRLKSSRRNLQVSVSTVVSVSISQHVSRKWTILLIYLTLSCSILVPENKLFIGMLSRKATETEVHELFSSYGEIREIYMIRNADGSSKCAAFLRFVKKEAAIQAIENLNGNIMMEGAARPLIVKFADNKHQRQQRHMRNMRRHDMIPPGAYHPAYPPQVPPPMAMHPHPGQGPQYPHMQPPQYGPPAYGQPGQPPPPMHPYMYPPQYGPAPPFPYQPRQEIRPPNPRPREGPAGANLFVYHLPHDLTDADLATAFNSFGNVISAKVYVDKYTGESKGFGKWKKNEGFM